MLGVAMRPAPVLLIAVQSHGHWFGMGGPRGMGAEGMLGSIQPQAEIKSHSTPFAVMICLFGLASSFNVLWSLGGHKVDSPSLASPTMRIPLLALATLGQFTTTAATNNLNPLPAYPLAHVPSNRRALQTMVSDVTGLVNALGNAAVGHIIVAAGRYALAAELRVDRSVVIEAAVASSVVLDAGKASHRVLNIAPGSSSDVVELIGLNVTGGRVSRTNGGGLLISQGQVVITDVAVYDNKADWVRAFPEHSSYAPVGRNFQELIKLVIESR